MDNYKITTIEMIAAMDETGGIGINNNLPPWKIKEDLSFFQNMTTGNTVIMGSNTFISLPLHKRPLPNRFNIVITRDPKKYASFYPEVFFTDSTNIKNIIKVIPQNYKNKVFVIGGAQIYDLFFNNYDAIYITHIKGNYGCNIKLDLTKYTSFDYKTEIIEKTNFKIVKYEKY